MNILKWKGLDIDPMIISESMTAKAEISQIDTNFNESTNESGITVLYPKIEAIHEGRTRNYNRYTAEKLKGDYELKSGVYSWTQPYPKPVIHNHDTNTEATGRVYSASFTEFTQSGRPGIIVTPKITQEKAIKDILEGRLLTVSIGATTNAAICSLCGTDIINEGFCGHMRGEEYDGQVVEWIAGDLFFDELSWVNVPADPDAMILGTGLMNNQIATQEKIVATAGHPDSNAKIIPVTAESISTEIDSTNTTLTAEGGVVKSVSESTEKEDENVENELAPEVTPDITPDVTTEAPAETAPEATTQEATPADAEITPEQTQEDALVIEDIATQEATIIDAPAAELAVEEGRDFAAELEAAQNELIEAKNEIEELKNANLQLAKAQQESAVGFLVDLRMAIGKEASREDAVAKFASRSLESLNDSIADILVEKPALGNTRTVETVVKPSGVVIAESKTLATDKVKVISNEDVLLSLLSGQK